jgi:hypothetical protein
MLEGSPAHNEYANYDGKYYEASGHFDPAVRQPYLTPFCLSGAPELPFTCT